MQELINAVSQYIPEGLAKIANGRDNLPTNEAAYSISASPKTIRKHLCLYGHFHGVKPVRIGGRLYFLLVIRRIMSFTLLSEFRKMPKDEMTSGCKLVLYYLCDLANEQTRIAFPSVETIGKEVGLSTKQARRYTHELEKRGWVKIVSNRLGGDKGKSCRYKITLPPIKKKTTFIINENYTPPTQAPNPSHTRAVTPPSDGSLTVVKPYITNIDLNKKFGFGWGKNPDTAYQAGLAIGIQARPGEDTYTFVNQIYAALNKNKSAYA